VSHGARQQHPCYVQEKDLKVHLASIGGQIERYQPVPNSPRCLVTFTDHKGIGLFLCLLFNLSVLFKVNWVVLFLCYANCSFNA
jgi:hypothetical protein